MEAGLGSEWGRNEAGMKDTGAGTLQAGAVWNLPSPSTSNVWRISARPMSWRSPSIPSTPKQTPQSQSQRDCRLAYPR